MATSARRGSRVKLLALAPGHRMARDVVLEMLWPKLSAGAAAANLHKAASHARDALGGRAGVVLRGGVVAPAPGAEVTVDVERFERGDDAAYGGELLPDDQYEQWALGPRARLRERHLAVLRSRGRWEEVLRDDAGDEEAHRALMRRAVASGDRPAAARQFRLLRDELRGWARSRPRRRWRFNASLRAARPSARHGFSTLRSKDASVTRLRPLACSRGPLTADGGVLLVVGPLGIGRRGLSRLCSPRLRSSVFTPFVARSGGGGPRAVAPLVEALDPLAERRPDWPARSPTARKPRCRGSALGSRAGGGGGGRRPSSRLLGNRSAAGGGRCGARRGARHRRPERC